MTRIELGTTERIVMAIVAAVAILVAVGIVAIISPVWPPLPRMMGQIAAIAVVMWLAIGTCVLIGVFVWTVINHAIQQARSARLARRQTTTIHRGTSKLQQNQHLSPLFM